jgi:alpha-ketoglutarate-dependent sulfate ester dioxygenase
MTTTLTSTRLDIRKLTARIRAEVTGAGPALELDAGTVTALRAALNEHKALVFRGISIDDAGQQRFARYFGELTTAHPTVPAVASAPNVLPVDSEDGRANRWHTNVTFVPNPPQASTLRSIVIPPYGGDADRQPGQMLIQGSDS